MLELHQRAACLPLEPGTTWLYQVAARFHTAATASAGWAVEIQSLAWGDEGAAAIRGVLERSSGGALPLAEDFSGGVDLQSREFSLQTTGGWHLEGQFSENGRVATVRTQVGDRPWSAALHLVQSETCRALLGR